MADDESRLIQALNDAKDNETLLKELNSFHLTLSKQEKLPPEKASLHQNLTSLLIPQLFKSSDVLFLDVSLAILRYMSRDTDVVLKYMSSPDFVEFLCLVGGFKIQDAKTVLHFDNINETARLDSCRCLCNVMYLARNKRELKLFSDGIFLQSLVKQITNHKKCSLELSKIALRLLFLVAALSSQGRKMLIDEYDARKTILDCLKDVVTSDSVSNDRSLVLSEADTELCSEIMKVVFYLNMDLRRKNIFNQQELQELDSLVELSAIVLKADTENDSLTEGLHCNAGNAIYSVPPGCLTLSKLIGPPESGDDDVANMKPITTLLDILQSHVMKDEIVIDILHPLLALFSQLCRLSRDIRVYVKERILPPRKDFKLRPEEGKELRNKLIKLFTHNNTDLKHGAADFIFVLCKEKTDRFVKYTGYGNAAGLLHLRGLLAGGRGETVYSDTDSDSDTEEYKQVRDEVNPVTGHIPTQKENPLENMTEEQKEYLAMQLMNQVSKLSTDNVIQPMCVGEDGKLIPFQQKVHETHLPEEPASSDEDT